ncbi:MAG: L,D-transpeptidase [Burkholderiales bacterium]|nr:L,D-transpeptidase [Burkholderiales bacterium]
MAWPAYTLGAEVASSASASAWPPSAPASASPPAASAAASAVASAVSAAAKRAADVAAHLDPRDALQLASQFESDVTRRLAVPPAAQSAYGERLQAALTGKGLGALVRQYVVLVDRNPNVQALFIYFRGDPAGKWTLIGASPVSTGWPGRYDHFVTPLGVFEHTPSNMDFRAEGTPNENGIRGYGARDMRIFDFGWTDAERGWGKGGISSMRFQMHATDPDKLEPLLGIRHSKGCVRIPNSLDRFLDHYGVLDAEYEAAADAGVGFWVLHSDRAVTPWAGRYLVVVDSGAKARPAWSPLPRRELRARMQGNADTAD